LPFLANDGSQTPWPSVPGRTAQREMLRRQLVGKPACFRLHERLEVLSKESVITRNYLPETL
jgi:hypothetical protein